MTEENISQEVRLINLDETKTYLIEEINKVKWCVKYRKRFVQL